jgi:hypothetical protein
MESIRINCVNNWPRITTALTPYLKTKSITNDDYNHFEGVPLLTMDFLMTKQFIDPMQTQNESPSVQEFCDFVARYPGRKLTFHGYMIGPKRTDCRVSIEGLAFDAIEDQKARESFIVFCRSADELLVTDTYLYAWWD